MSLCLSLPTLAAQPPAAPTAKPAQPQPTEPVDQPEPTETEPVEPAKTDPNPLNPAGDSIDKLITMQINSDLWKSMMGALPCLESTDQCIGQLQELAITNSRELKAIDERIAAITAKVAEAKKNNAASVKLGVFEPLVQSYLKIDTTIVNGQPQKRGFFNKIGALFTGLTGINEVLSLIGLPLFQRASGGDAAQQSRVIAIGDLQVKLAEIENRRGDIAAKIRENVALQVFDFVEFSQNFRISQEIAKRQAVQLRVIEIGYRYGTGSTEGFLGQLNSLDRTKAQTFREWTKVRAQLGRVKLNVLGAESAGE